MGNVFAPGHPNNMTDTAPSGVADEYTATPGTGDAEPVGGVTGDQDDLPDFNALGDKTATAQA